MGALGPKESFYLEVARDEWAPILRKREVKQGMLVGGIGVFCLAVSIYALVTLKDPTPFIAGLAFTGWGLSTVWPFRGAFRAWRTIGPVHLEFAEGALVPGEAGQLEVVVRPRRGGTVRAVTLTLWARDSRGAAAVAPWDRGIAFDAVLASPTLTPGTEWRCAVPVALDPSAPASRFEQGFQRQWRLQATLELDDGRAWAREYPVIVYG